MAETGKDIARAVDILKSGKLVAIPTETVYGLAANALDIQAITKIFKTKNRPEFDPLIVHLAGADQLKEYVIDPPEICYELAEKFWPGPLTILLPKKPAIPDLVTSGLPRVAIRVPGHPLALSLLKALPFPLAAPSANPFGYVSPTCAKHVNDQLGDKIEYILDGGECNVGIESTIIGFENNDPVIYRLGGIAISELEKVMGPIHKIKTSSSNPESPGALKSHYSPSKKVLIGKIDELIIKFDPKDIGILSFKKKYESVPDSQHFILSESGDMDEAARRLFSGLRFLDTLNCKVVLAEYVPETGLGLAINDRLRRASAKSIT